MAGDIIPLPVRRRPWHANMSPADMIWLGRQFKRKVQYLRSRLDATDLVSWGEDVVADTAWSLPDMTIKVQGERATNFGLSFDGYCRWIAFRWSFRRPFLRLYAMSFRFAGTR